MSTSVSSTHSSAVIAVTGSTGRLGSRVARLLADAGAAQILIGRDPGRAPSLDGAERRGPAAYSDTTAMGSALQGASRLLLVSGNLSGRRLAEHSSVIDAACRAGVERVVYVSLLGAAADATYVNARDHAATEDYLAASPVASWTVLRPSFYSSMMPGLANEHGIIRGPAEDGAVSAVAHDDIARVAVAVLLADDDSHAGRTYAVTGPEAVDLAGVARRLTEATGRPYSYRPESVEEAYRWRRELDATPTQIEGWVSWYQAIARGEVSEVSDVVETVTGRVPLTIGENVSDPTGPG